MPRSLLHKLLAYRIQHIAWHLSPSRKLYRVFTTLGISPSTDHHSLTPLSAKLGPSKIPLNLYRSFDWRVRIRAPTPTSPTPPYVSSRKNLPVWNGNCASFTQQPHPNFPTTTALKDDGCLIDTLVAACVREPHNAAGACEEGSPFRRVTPTYPFKSGTPL